MDAKAEGRAALDIAGWQALLDRHSAIFAGMLPGSRIGLLPEEDFESPAAMMLVWEATGNGMVADYRCFPGFEQAAVDLLFVADGETLGRLHDRANPAPLADLKRKVRRRETLLYVVKPRATLLELGYEEFLDSLGLAFMGACR
ncbi:MAG TPA: hypothetical protein VN832_10355 [Stellaceae bacterium]|nr:hypothetical protein [Stellaceae bacterium]